MENVNRIKGALADAGKTGIWLAGQLGKDPVTVSKWCTNTTRPDLQKLAKISELLNNSSLKFEIMAKQLYVASQRVL